MRQIIVSLILISSLIISGCLDSENLDDLSCPNVDAPIGTAPTEISFSGENDTVTDFFKLEQYLLLFDTKHEGDGHFSIVIYGTEDEYLDLIVNEIGMFEFEVYASLDLELDPFWSEYGLSGQDFFLEISADGPWQIVISQPRFSEGSGEPISISGTGTTASTSYYFDCGLRTVDVNHYGDGHFSVVIYDVSGDYIELLANEVDEYSGTSILDIDKKGLYVFDISANLDANWDFTIGNIPSSSSSEEEET